MRLWIGMLKVPINADKKYCMLRQYLERWNTWKQLSVNRQIFLAVLIVAIMTVVAKLATVVKELVVAHTFGTSNMIDAFLIAFILPMFVISIVAGSFGSAVMPTYIRTKDKSGEVLAQKLFSSIQILAVVILIVSVLILAALAPVLLPLLGSGFDQQTIALTQSLFYWLLPVVLITGISQIFSIIINANKRFLTVALAPIITPICSIVILLLFVDTIGVYTLAIGVLIGSIFELIIIVRSASRYNISVMPKWQGMSNEVRTVIGQFVPMLAGAFLMSSTILVDQAMAAMLESGSVATLNYASRMVATILGIGALALGAAVLPYFSRMVADEKWTDIYHALWTYSRFIVLISLPIVFFLFVFSESIIGLLFERGVFNAKDTQLVGEVQAWYLLQIPFYLLSILAVKLISAMKKNEILLKIAIVNLIVNIVGNYILMQYFGIAGIALSTAIVYALSCLMLFIYLNFKLKGER
jgi:putative peptidoglycan lipid II flippase